MNFSDENLPELFEVMLAKEDRRTPSSLKRFRWLHANQLVDEGKLALKGGRPGVAKEKFQLALERYRQVGSQESLNTLFLLTHALYDLGEFSEAKSLILATVSEAGSALVSDRDLELEMLYWRGLVDAKLGDDQASYAAMEALWQSVDERLVPIVSELCAMYVRESRTNELGLLLRATVEQGTRVMEHDPSAMQTVAGLGSVLLENSRQGGLDELQTLQCRNMVALGLWANNRPKEAAQLYDQTVSGLKRTVGPVHPATLDAVYGLGLAHDSLGYYSIAARLLAEAMAGRKKLFGPAHPATQRVAGSLAGMYIKCGMSSDEVWNWLNGAEESFEGTMDELFPDLGRDVNS